MTCLETMPANLIKAGYKWVVISNNDISRAVLNYEYSKFRDNFTLSSRADLINHTQSIWYNIKSSIVLLLQLVPFPFMANYAKHLDLAASQEY
jgi:hypothetical protein